MKLTSLVKLFDEEDFMKLKNSNCGSCDDSKQGRAYLDKETGLLCISLEEKYDKPKDKKVLVPYVCSTCGTTEWRTIDPEEKDC